MICVKSCSPLGGYFTNNDCSTEDNHSIGQVIYIRRKFPKMFRPTLLDIGFLDQLF